MAACDAGKFPWRLAVAAASCAAVKVVLFGTGLCKRLLLHKQGASARARIALALQPRNAYAVQHLELLKCDTNQVVFRLCNHHATQNFLASFHGGCLATTVDAATSVALIAAGACPGVSVSLTVDFVNGCSHDASVLVEAKVLRTGRNLAFTECLLRREADGVLMARATHVKFVKEPMLWGLFLRFRPSILDFFLRRLKPEFDNVFTNALANKMPTYVLPDRAPFDSAVEPDTLLPRDEAGKREYFATFGDGTYAFQGWDAPLRGALKLRERDVDLKAADRDGAVWDFTPSAAHANANGCAHGGATASLVDVLGSALIAMGDAQECGVATSLEVHYLKPMPLHKSVRFAATTLKRGGRLATVEVKATDSRGALLAVGYVTKSLRGLSKTKAP